MARASNLKVATLRARSSNVQRIEMLWWPLVLPSENEWFIDTWEKAQPEFLPKWFLKDLGIEDGPKHKAPVHLGGRLLDVTGLCHFAHGELLAVGQRFFNSALTGKCGCNLLTHVVADALKLWDRYELNASVRRW